MQFVPFSTLLIVIWSKLFLILSSLELDCFINIFYFFKLEILAAMLLFKNESQNNTYLSIYSGIHHLHECWLPFFLMNKGLNKVFLYAKCAIGNRPLQNPKGSHYNQRQT